MNTAHRSICSYFHKLEFQPRTMVKPKLCSRGKHFHRAQPGSCRIVVASQSSRATMSCMLFVAASGLVYCMEHYWGGDRDHNINVILPAFERSITVKRFKCRKLTKIPQNHQAYIYIFHMNSIHFLLEMCGSEVMDMVLLAIWWPSVWRRLELLSWSSTGTDPWILDRINLGKSGKIWRKLDIQMHSDKFQINPYESR